MFGVLFFITFTVSDFQTLLFFRYRSVHTKPSASLILPPRVFLRLLRLRQQEEN